MLITFLFWLWRTSFRLVGRIMLRKPDLVVIAGPKNNLYIIIIQYSRDNSKWNEGGNACHHYLFLYRIVRFRFFIRSQVRGTLDLPHDVVPLAEECEPFVQHRLLLLGQIVPVRSAVLRFEGGTGKSARGILASEDCR